MAVKKENIFITKGKDAGINVLLFSNYGFHSDPFITNNKGTNNIYQPS